MPRKKRTLYLKPTSNKQLEDKWGFNPALIGSLYIQCNKEGEINWDKASVYDKKATSLDHVVVINK